MIITRTPFRVSFVGGGSDIREYYSRHERGCVISSAIRQYMYIVIHPYFQDKIRIKYSRTEDVDSIDEIKHPIVRECLKKVGVRSGVEIASFADVSAGTGLGSSSSFTVGLLHALYAFNGIQVSKHQLAEEACEIEIEILKEPIGKQDQYAAAFGDICQYNFKADEQVDVQHIALNREIVSELEKGLALYYVGGVRSASKILSKQKENLSRGEQSSFMKEMVTMVPEMKAFLEQGDTQSIARRLNDAWQLKKKMASGITNNEIDDLYEKAIVSGALGGKLLGAGGNGFLLLVANDHEQLAKKLNCRFLPYQVDYDGSKLLFNDLT